MDIWAVKAFSTGTANVKFDKGDKQISLAFDDSCGTQENLTRATIACFKGNDNKTDEVFGQEFDVYATLENFKEALVWLEK